MNAQRVKSIPNTIFVIRFIENRWFCYRHFTDENIRMISRIGKMFATEMSDVVGDLGFF